MSISVTVLACGNHYVATKKALQQLPIIGHFKSFVVLVPGRSFPSWSTHQHSLVALTLNFFVSSIKFASWDQGRSEGLQKSLAILTLARRHATPSKRKKHFYFRCAKTFGDIH